jgi:hypothetical protein
MTNLNRFEKAIGIRTRPRLKAGDVVLLSKSCPKWMLTQYGKRSKWVVARRARTSRFHRDPSDGLCYFWIRNMKTREETMVARRNLWKTGWNIRKSYEFLEMLSS